MCNKIIWVDPVRLRFGRSGTVGEKSGLTIDVHGIFNENKRRKHDIIEEILRITNLLLLNP
jgi:hypothetical protein